MTTVKTSDDEPFGENLAQTGTRISNQCNENTKPASCRQHDACLSDPFEHFSWISEMAPCIPVDGDKIKVLDEPSEFYQTLKVECFSSFHCGSHLSDQLMF